MAEIFPMQRKTLSNQSFPICCRRFVSAHKGIYTHLRPISNKVYIYSYRTHTRPISNKVYIYSYRTHTRPIWNEVDVYTLKQGGYLHIHTQG